MGNYFKHPNYFFAAKTEDGRVIANCVGNVTNNFPFLTETQSGKLVTPFYLNEGVKLGAVSPNAVILNGMTKEVYKIPTVAQELKNLRLPTVALNISVDRYEKAVSYAPILSEVSRQFKEDGSGIVLFLPILAFEENAVFLHKQVMKGDTISATGELKLTKVGSLRATPILWVNDVQKIRIANRNNMEGASVVEA
jgi:hypothetical protein